jgi:SagB-type dehydrogenase family enzyme
MIIKTVLLNFVFLFGLFIHSDDDIRDTYKISNSSPNMTNNQSSYNLPKPDLTGRVTLEHTILNRRSRRDFRDKEISMEDLSQILWAAYGITKPIKDYRGLRGGFRTSPSAGARYPLEIYVVVGKVSKLEPGVYKYNSEFHKLTRVMDKDIRRELCASALYQKMIKEAPVSLVYTAIFSRCTSKYGKRGRERYVCMELGHSAQNVYLQVEALHLGTCAVGAFSDSKVTDLLKLPVEEEPLYIMPIGHYYYKK